VLHFPAANVDFSPTPEVKVGLSMVLYDKYMIYCNLYFNLCGPRKDFLDIREHRLQGLLKGMTGDTYSKFMGKKGPKSEQQS